MAKAKPEGQSPEVVEDPVMRTDDGPGEQDPPEGQSPEVVKDEESLGTVTDAHHAVALIKTKATQLHQLIHNIGSIAEAPVLAIENLVAEIRFLIGVVRGS